MPHTSVRPARLRFHSSELSTQVLRTFGYQARCACGWQGPVRGKHSDARGDAKGHRAEQHP